MGLLVGTRQARQSWRRFIILGIIFLLTLSLSVTGRPALGADPGAGTDWFWRQRALPAGEVPAAVAYQAAVGSLRSRAGSKAAAPTWIPLGPAPVQKVHMYGAGDLTASGRALSIAVDPTDSNILLLGAAQGGIWRSTDAAASFIPVGDNLPAQAVKVIRFAPSDPRIVYAGSGEPHSKTSIFGMGLFKSLDGGLTWTTLPASGPGWDFRYVSISGLQVDPDNPDILYVTTADVLPDRVDVFHPPPGTPPCAIFKSIDGGMSWTAKQLAVDYRQYDFPAHDPYLASGYGFMDLELLRLNSSVLFATERSGGIYRSTDAGETWVRLTPVKNPGGDAAAGADFPAPVPRFSYFDPDTVSFVTYPVLSRSRTTPEFNRIEIGLAQGGSGVTGEADQAVLYAGYSTILLLDVNNNGRFDEGTDIEQPTALLFKTTDGGAAWTWLGDWANDGMPAYCDPFPTSFNNGLYDHVVEVNPLDPMEVIVGGNANYNEYWPDPIINPTRILKQPWNGVVYRSIDGGATWVNAVPACARYEPAPDQPPINGLPVYHCAEVSSQLSIHPDAMSATYDWPNQRIYVTHDGGLSRCTIRNGACLWDSPNNDLGTLQFFDFDVHPFNPDIIQGGMQDNATAYYDGTEWDSWDWDESDGTTGRFDPQDPRRVYIGWQYALARHDQGGGQTREEWQILFENQINGDDDLPFVTLLSIDPTDSRVIYTASTSGVYRSADYGETWGPRLNPQPLQGEPTAIAVIPDRPHLVWTGTSAGRIYLFDTAGGTVTDLTGSNLPNRWITRIGPSFDNSLAAVVTFSGYDAASSRPDLGGNGNVGRVFATRDLGQTWLDISGNLTAANGLDVPVSALALDSRSRERFWIGTDIGVFETTNNGLNWALFRGNMPVVAIMTLHYSYLSGYLTAATFGRSIWRTSVEGFQPADGNGGCFLNCR